MDESRRGRKTLHQHDIQLNRTLSNYRVEKAEGMIVK